jgi:hypothetical protein
MSSIVIHDLARSEALDATAMSAVRGGSLASIASAPFANVDVNVDIDQTIQQLQQINVAALNNVGVIGADLGFKLDVKPIQTATAGITL